MDKMRLTKKKAIEISIELWEWLAETGKRKGCWDGWDKYGRMTAGCALCEYDKQHGDSCESCPYYECYEDCEEAGKPYNLWHYARTRQTRKKYAKLFLEQLRGL